MLMGCWVLLSCRDPPGRLEWSWVKAALQLVSWAVEGAVLTGLWGKMSFLPQPKAESSFGF